MDLTSRVTWRKSSYSSSSGDNCIEVGSSPRTVAALSAKLV
jgi:Domain of unknown function (DUF397)